MSTLPRFQVECYVDGRQNFYHLSKIHAGLLELYRRGDIQLRFQSARPLVSQSVGAPWTEWIQVARGLDGEFRRVAFDLGDHSHVFNETALRHCQVYYKRNLCDSDLEGLPDDLRLKVQPFGLNFACRFSNQIGIVLRRALPSLLMRTLASPGTEVRRLRKRVDAMRQFMSVLPVADYEQPPDHPVEPVVFTQFMVWSAPPSRRNVEEEVNRPRVELVRALRREFGRRFVGGLAPTKYARRNYPDAVSPISARREEFIAASKRALIGVASAPCVMTGSFKLAEYLAASRCIVSYPMSSRLPTPLVEGLNYLAYRTADECVQRCAEVLEDRALGEQMRQNNWEYYGREVAPAAHMMNLLSRCFASSVEVANGPRNMDVGSTRPKKQTRGSAWKPWVVV